MQIGGMLIFLGIWLLILWLGSVALEVTGMERTRARFQALSALSGTGFTTREAESIVNHPKRRMIISWLIFLGSVGILAFIIVMILYLRTGFAAPAPFQVAIIVGSLIVFGLVVWLGAIRKITDATVGLLDRRQHIANLTSGEIIYQLGQYGVAMVSVSKKDNLDSFTLGGTGLKDRELMVLAIERADKTIPFPGPEVMLAAGDYLLCYGKISDLANLTV